MMMKVCVVIKFCFSEKIYYIELWDIGIIRFNKIIVQLAGTYISKMTISNVYLVDQIVVRSGRVESNYYWIDQILKFLVVIQFLDIFLVNLIIHFYVEFNIYINDTIKPTFF